MSANHDPPTPSEPEAATDEAAESPEEIRERHRRDEALVRALGRLQLVVGLLAAAASFALLFTTWETYRLVSAPGAKVTAPWVFDPARLAFCSVFAMYGLVALVAGYGLWHLRMWARRALMASLYLVLISILMAWVYTTVGDSASPDSLAAAIYLPVFALPALAFAYVSRTPGGRAVLSAEYAEIVDRTARVRVKPRLPWSMRLVLAALVLLHFLAAFAVVAVDEAQKRP